MDTKDEIYHHRCLEIAKNGLGYVSPNPMVGCVIVHKDKIISEGYHQQFGGPHAEVNAINALPDKSVLSECTLFVNLEPCAHFGKTPPCADLIIEHKIPKVIIGCRDPFDAVNGKGIEKLKNAGIEVVLKFEKESIELNKRFFTFHLKKRPYIILKWAETSDGYIDIIRKSEESKRPTWITDEVTRTMVHKWRKEEDAIIVGTNTAYYDNPKLNVRDYSGRAPIRMVIDRNLRLPDTLHLFDKSQPTVVFNEIKSETTGNLKFEKIDFDNLTGELCSYLYAYKIQSLIVEGGTQLINTFIKQGLWDEARVFRADVAFGNGIKAPTLPIEPLTHERLIKSTLYYYRNS